MDHALWPIGPVGKPTELHLMYPVLAMNYTKYPQACKALIAFMLEADQFNKWIELGAGLSDPLPQRLRFQPGLDRRSQAHGVPRRRQALADRRRPGLGRREGGGGDRRLSCVLDMFANYCTGREDAKGAIADRRAASCSGSIAERHADVMAAASASLGAAPMPLGA